MDLSTSFNNQIKCYSFWQSINILITKPHVVNKRLWGCTVLCRYFMRNHIDRLENVLKACKFTLENKCKYLDIILENTGAEVIKEFETDYEIMLVQLLPKSYLETNAFQIIYRNKLDARVTFIDVTPEDSKQNLCPTFPYSFSLHNGQVLLETHDKLSKSYEWLKNIVLPQVIKWCTEISSNQTQLCNGSLTLVSNEKYYTKYNDLKLRYGKEMVKIWPECTDPTKFVYEDVAIATYLLLLWEYNSKPQTFVDIGCGNGLLVYILTMEGHTGYGVDVRKRKIWDLYPDNIKLKEATVSPSNMHMFSNIDWIIGNHSDELTPWIPVIAAQSSYKCNFFLLPCCAYNFDGTKYQRQNSSKSQYNEYLEYIKELCEHCGFDVDIDRLKIPSTKRICLISKTRTYIENEHEEYVNIIKNMITKQIGQGHNKVDNDNEIKEIKTRDPVERVRNCTQLDKNVTESIINRISKYLLEGCEVEATWSKGKNSTLQELINIIPHEELKALKSECGGLQTLLRNNHNIFEVQNGCVSLRYPRTIDEVNRNTKRRKGADGLKMQVKKCWFYNNHPQGCPLNSAVCSFLHEKTV